jgi:uracil-DNA glycosylase family 4
MPKNSFLDDMDLQIIRGDEGKTRTKKAKQKTFTCSDCGLKMQCQTPKFPVWGNGEKKILVILDTPSTKEDELSEPFSGPRGTLLKELLKDKLGISIKKDCWVTYAVRCCSRKNIKAFNVDACRKYLHEDINELKPVVIIPFGYWAMIGISGDILTSKSRGKYTEDWTDYTIPDQRFLSWIVPTWDIFQLNLETNKPDSVKIMQFVTHWKNAIRLLNVPVNKIDYEKKVKILKKDTEIIEVLYRLIERAKSGKLTLSLDYEATGRKPHRKGHEITTISISDGNWAWAFNYDIKDNFVTILFRQLLKSKNVYWRVHNVQLEWIWSYVILGLWPTNLDQDTILGIHTMNSNKRKGLKPIVYCLFGVAGYDDVTEEYISATASEEKIHGANAFNLMKQLKNGDGLLYNGLDSLFTFLIAEYINNNLRKENWIGYNFLMEGAINLVKAQQNGLRVDTTGVSSAKEKLTKELNTLENQIQKMAVKLGWNRGEQFRPSAPDDVSRLLFDILRYEPSKTTPAGKPSTDKEALDKINNPIVNLILEWKKLQKLRDTYINGLVVEVVNGFMHPFFNLYTVNTYRSSSSNFNFQNIPKRDKMSNKIIRELLFPHIGQKLNEYDYKGIEVAVAACYCQDRNLINYVSDPKTDMHRDTGIELFCYEDNPQDFLKDDRQIAKNKFVFPQFYGSYFELDAPPLYEKCTPEARANLKLHGIRNLKDFTEHVREIEYSFWNDRFPEYAQWKKDTYKFYLKHGYLDSYTGFRYYGPMTKNEVLNRCIQGSAHHVLLRTFNKISDVIENEKLKSKMIGQIHDSMIPSIEPDEESYIDKMIWYYGTQEIKEDWKWIIVPIEIEKSGGAVDRPWSEMVEMGLLGVNGKVIKK